MQGHDDHKRVQDFMTQNNPITKNARTEHKSIDPQQFIGFLAAATVSFSWTLFAASSFEFGKAI